jgi:hypothetical protein
LHVFISTLIEKALSQRKNKNQYTIEEESDIQSSYEKTQELTFLS